MLWEIILDIQYMVLYSSRNERVEGNDLKGIQTMPNYRALIERRKNTRFQVKGNAFVVLRSSPEDLVGQIIDVSLGGLAFTYFDRRGRLNESAEIAILFPSDWFFLEKVPIKTILDANMGYKNAFSNIIRRRRGVQFGDLTFYQVSQLEFFIQKYAMCERDLKFAFIKSYKRQPHTAI